MLKYLLLSVLITLSLACGPVDEEAEANKQFVKAITLLEAAESESAAPAKLSLLEQAETTLQTIIARYPSTALAVKLTSGQQIGNVSLATVEAAVEAARGPACQAAPTSACVIAQALALAQTFEWGQDSALVHITRALIDIALAQAQVGDHVEAQATIAQALALVQTFDEKTVRAMALSDIALAQARVGDRTGAQATIAQALALAQTLTDEEGRPLTDEGGRATMLAIVALAQAQAGDRAGARVTITQALALARTLPDEDGQAMALGFVALAQAQAGDRAGAQDTTSQALALVQALSQALPEEGRGEALAFLVFLQPQVKAGDTAQALALVQTFSDDWVRALALTFVAQAQAQAGDRAGAQATISQALTHAQALSNERSRASVLGDIAPVQAQSGDHAGAQATITQLLVLTQTFPKISRASVLASIAQAQAYMGDGVQALALVQTLAGERDRVKALADIALALARIDARDAQGASFWGWENR